MGHRSPSIQCLWTDTLFCPKGSSSSFLLVQLLKLREEKARVQRGNVTILKVTEPVTDRVSPRTEAPRFFGVRKPGAFEPRRHMKNNRYGVLFLCVRYSVRCFTALTAAASVH